MDAPCGRSPLTPNNSSTLSQTGGPPMCKGGAQIVDRFWQRLRGFLKARSSPVASAPLVRRIRSAQWAYWHTDEDLWLETGKMFGRLRGDAGASR